MRRAAAGSRQQGRPAQQQQRSSSRGRGTPAAAAATAMEWSGQDRRPRPHLERRAPQEQEAQRGALQEAEARAKGRRLSNQSNIMPIQSGRSGEATTKGKMHMKASRKPPRRSMRRKKRRTSEPHRGKRLSDILRCGSRRGSGATGAALVHRCTAGPVAGGLALLVTKVIDAAGSPEPAPPFSAAAVQVATGPALQHTAKKTGKPLAKPL